MAHHQQIVNVNTLPIVAQANIYQQKVHQQLIANAKHAQMEHLAQIKIKIIVSKKLFWAKNIFKKIFVF